MTLHRSIAAFWLLVFLAVVVTVLDSKAQQWSVNYNPNTVASGQVQYWNGSAWAAVVTTAAGRSMMTAADAVAQRALLSLDSLYGRLATTGSWSATQNMTGAGNAWYSGGATSKAGIRVHPNGDEGFVVLEYAGAATDRKNWQWAVGNGFTFIGTASDSYSAANFGIWLQNTTGGAISSITFHTGSSIGPEHLGITPSGVRTGSTGDYFAAIRHESATLNGTSGVTVTDAAVATGDAIVPIGIGTTNAGALSYTINSGVSYTIYSTNASDARDVSIMIYEH